MPRKCCAQLPAFEWVEDAPVTLLRISNRLQCAQWQGQGVNEAIQKARLIDGGDDLGGGTRFTASKFVPENKDLTVDAGAAAGT